MFFPNQIVFFPNRIVTLSFGLLFVNCVMLAGSASGWQEPVLPETPFAYSDMTRLPMHFTDSTYPIGPPMVLADNEPANNQVSDAGATLGRVLFYDTNLSLNNSVSCASCHQQEHGFSDPLPFSLGFNGGLTGRHSMGLANGRYYDNGRMFWDERAATLEDQVLMPIQDSVEMGMDLTSLEIKLGAVPYYAGLFEDAFGDPAITSDRISRSLAQFCRSLISYESKMDEALQAGTYPNPDFPAVFTPQELHGLALFQPIQGGGRTLNCVECHATATQTLGAPEVPGVSPAGPFAVNIGLDIDTTADQGAGDGRFKSPALRNIEVTAPYMHDGRFNTLEEVVEFYNSGIQAHPNLDERLRESPNGPPIRFNMNPTEKNALVAFLKTLTDHEFLVREEFSDPFPTLVAPQSFAVESGILRAGDLQALLESDNQKVIVNGGVAAISVQAVSPTPSPTFLEISIESRIRPTPSARMIQEIFLFNYVMDDFELVDVQPVSSNADKVVSIRATGDLSRFVQPGTLAIEAKFAIRRDSGSVRKSGYFDHVSWSIR